MKHSPAVYNAMLTTMPPTRGHDLKRESRL